jgi:hypothetical protein
MAKGKINELINWLDSNVNASEFEEKARELRNMENAKLQKETRQNRFRLNSNNKKLLVEFDLSTQVKNSI